MMNVIEIQDKLKNFSQDQLINEMQMPSGSVPQYLVLSEINRRKRMQDSYEQEQNSQKADQTVAQEKLAAAGVPEEGIASLAAALSPKTDMAQNTGATPQQSMPAPQAPPPMAEAMPPQMPPPQMMPPQGAGIMSMAGGGPVQRMQAGGSPVATSKGFFYVSRDGLTVTDIQGNPAPEDVAREARAKKYDFGVRNAAERDAAFPVSSALSRNLGRFVRGAPETGEQLGQMPPSLNDTSLRAPQIPSENFFPRLSGSQEFFPSETPIANVMDSDLSSNMDYRLANMAATRAAMREPVEPTGIMPPLDIYSPVRTPFPSNQNTQSLMDEQAAMRQAMRGPATGIMPPIDFDATSTEAFPSNRNTPAILRELAAKREAMRTPTDIGDTVMMSPSDQRILDARRKIENRAKDTEALDSFLGNRRATMGSITSGRSGSDVASPDDLMTYGYEEPSPMRDIGDFLVASEASRPALDVAPVDMSKMMPPIFDPSLERSRDPYSAGVDALTQKALEKSKDGPSFLTRLREIFGQSPEAFAETESYPTSGGTPPKIPTKNETAKSQEAKDQAKISPPTDLSFGDLSSVPELTIPEILSGTSPDAKDASTAASAEEKSTTEYTPLESEIIDMLKKREKRADQDKWMALAQAGLAMMASKQPTLLGAAGEAGMIGMQQLSKSREAYDDAKLALLGLRQKIDASRETKAAASKKATREYYNDLIDDTRAQLDDLLDDARSYRKLETDAMGEAKLIDKTPPGLQANIVALEKRLQRLMAARGGSSMPSFDATRPIARAAGQEYSFGSLVPSVALQPQ